MVTGWWIHSFIPPITSFWFTQAQKCTFMSKLECTGIGTASWYKELFSVTDHIVLQSSLRRHMGIWHCFSVTLMEEL